jgi:glycosyltransferase involved in cell wall biosynthesis
MQQFSVLMSVYAKEKADFFNLSIESILVNQIQKPDEFVLVCDGPLTPELDAVIHNYEQKYPDVFKVLRTEQNAGIGNALKYGLSNCRNEIIIRADSDDVCVPDRIKAQTEYLLAHPEVAVVSSYIDEFEEDWKESRHLKTLPLEHDELAEMAKFRNPINHMAAAFRKDVILNIGSYQNIPCIEDYMLWVRAICNGYRLGNIDRVLVHARIGNGMVNRRGNRKYITAWRILSHYMLEMKMINRAEYVRNMLAIRTFTYMPSDLKRFLYSKILRK